MRHAALAALLLSLPPVAAAAEADFFGDLRAIRGAVLDPVTGRGPIMKADWVPPQRRETLSRLDAEQADLYAKSLPATFIVRVGQRGQRGSGTGSGYFISPDGTGMTNVHVVGAEIGKEVELETVRGIKKAKVLAVAPGRDIAIIKVSNDSFKDWAAFTMGSALRPGSNVFALGNPADTAAHGEAVISRGIVSVPAQDAVSAWLDVLQLDISLNPGNSGGALVNSSGELVGMNQAILRGDNVGGIGYAIPVQELARARDEFAATGKLEDGATRIGLAGDDLTVIAASGASAAAGFKVGDAIASFPGSASAAPGRKAQALYRAVGRLRPGQSLAVQVHRGAPCKIHTSAAAGGAPVASADCVLNPATGAVIAPGSPQLGAFLQAVTQASVEEIEFGGKRYAADAQGQPSSFGILFTAAGFAKKTVPAVTLNLPVELYSAPAESEDPQEGRAPVPGRSGRP